ncbi:MAG: tetratricopeptide repeat protein [Pseudomonadota bacterium]
MNSVTSVILATVVSLGVVAGSGINTAIAGSLSGAYLAGKHAGNRSDVEAAARYFAKALARDPENAALMEQALIYQAATGQIELALRSAKSLEAARPGHRMAALMLTADALRSGELETARTRLAETPGAYHPLVGAMLSAWSAYDPADLTAAEAAFATLDNRPIFKIFAGYHTGLMRHASGDVAGALEAFKGIAEQMQVPTGRMARAYGAALRDAGQVEEARAIYEGAMSVSVSDALMEADLAALEAGTEVEPLVLSPQDGAAEALFGLAAALGRDGEERLSLFYTRIAAWLRPDFNDAALLAAELLEGEEQYLLAIDAYETIPATSALSRSAEIGRADSLRKMGEEEQATEALKSLTRREPDAIDAHIALGDLLRRAEKFEDGAKAYSAAIRLMEDAGRPNWVLYYERGICYERSGEWDKAEADFFKALELQPDQPLVLNYLGYSWLEKGLNLDRALGMIEKAVQQRPDDGYIVDSLGWAHYLLENYPSAVRELEKAVELRPIDPVINDHLGDALWKVGRKLEAAFQWRRALSFDPEEKDAKRIRLKLADGLDAVLKSENAAKDTESSTANDG